MPMRKASERQGKLPCAPQSHAADAGPIEVTAASTIRELEEARQIAVAKQQAAAAISATLAKAKFAGLLDEKPESSRESAPARPVFDGNYREAARRIGLLLRLAEDETTDEQS